jgi:hypothetical protein
VIKARQPYCLNLKISLFSIFILLSPTALRILITKSVVRMEKEIEKLVLSPPPSHRITQARVLDEGKP